MKIEYAKMLKWFQHNHPDKMDRLIESLSPNQIVCKQWLASELEAWHLEHPDYEIHIEHIGGWFGWPLLDYISHLPIETYRNVEIDDFALRVFEQYVKNFDSFFTEYKSINENILDLRENNDSRRVRVVINTSSEHMPPLPEIVKNRGYVKEKPVFFLQSNDLFDEPDHINCVNSVDELADQSGLNKIYYMGEKDLGHYKRFMVVGKF